MKHIIPTILLSMVLVALPGCISASGPGPETLNTGTADTVISSDTPQRPTPIPAQDAGSFQDGGRATDAVTVTDTSVSTDASSDTGIPLEPDVVPEPDVAPEPDTTQPQDTQEPPECSELCGDANQDGELTLEDIQAFQTLMAKENAAVDSCVFAAADVIQDGQLTKRDLIFLDMLLQQGFGAEFSPGVEGGCEPCTLTCGDVNEDGALGPEDAQLLHAVSGAGCPQSMSILGR
jgi:hypothetical protein